LVINITRNKFNDICNRIFNKCIELVKIILVQAELKKEEIGKIVLTGGSTRIPYLQTLLSNYFEKELDKELNPDEAVAYGATIHAKNINKINPTSIILVDVTPLCLGIETKGGIMTTIIKNNTPIPTSGEITVSTTSDNQQTVILKIF